jgi:hypothetical protein
VPRCALPANTAIAPAIMIEMMAASVTRSADPDEPSATRRAEQLARERRGHDERVRGGGA